VTNVNHSMALPTSPAWRRQTTPGWLLGTAVLLWLCGGCSGVISRPAPSSLYQLHYTPEPGACNQRFPGDVRIWPLQAAAPYDQEAMVVLSDAAQVQFSAQHRWIAQPGQLLANWLIRDFGEDNTFTSVFASGEPFSTTFDLGGHLFSFGWKRQQQTSQAILDLEMTLVENQQGRARSILFRKHYQLVSQPSHDNGPEGFARAMSELLRDFSAVLRRDLCSASGGIEGWTIHAE
jgi:ABC-type uncharacterized transport system auxiliary subunit